jgi:hypothetical protein
MPADVALARALRAHHTREQLAVHGGGHSGWSNRIGQYLRFYTKACA